MMGTYVLLVFTVLACAAQGHLIPQIIGGSDAEEGAYPYQVSLKYKGSHLCGGSILDEYNILTAAHCVKNNLKLMEIDVGTNKLDEASGVYSVESASVHDDFNLEKLVNDIALLHIASPIKFNQKVKAIKLTESNVDEGPCKLTGWGYTRLSGGTPNDLQEIDLEIYPYKKCKTKYENTAMQVQKSHICSLTKKGEGACYGDSGGPLVVNDDGDDVQIGIVSFGRPCALGAPDVYTRVYSFLKWIEDNKKVKDDTKNI